jgi:hypothetical protein
MEFKDEILKNITWMGMSGYPLKRVALELNINLDELRKERLRNERLNDALNRYEFNAEAHFVDEMMKAAVSQKKNLIAEVYVELYRYLKEKNGI